MKTIHGYIVFMLLLLCSNTHASTITYTIEANSSSYAQLDIVTFANITGQLEVNVSGSDIWFSNINLSTEVIPSEDATQFPDEGYRLLETATGSYDGLDFTYQSPNQPYSSYFGSFDGVSLSLWTDYIFYSEIYGDVISVSTVPLPGAFYLFISGLTGLFLPKLFNKKLTNRPT